ncbi:MAG TPA: hypothetical protein PLR02_11890 [Rhodocyclaceae bacterium]|nr:hypothetical protein [Rhodocyclaceae bacterium]
MKFSKLTRRLGDLLSADRRRQREKIDKLKTLLRQMKKQQAVLEAALEDETDQTVKASLELKRQILIEQRRKGIQLRRELAGKPY